MPARGTSHQWWGYHAKLFCRRPRCLRGYDCSLANLARSSRSKFFSVSLTGGGHLVSISFKNNTGFLHGPFALSFSCHIAALSSRSEVIVIVIIILSYSEFPCSSFLPFLTRLLFPSLSPQPQLNSSFFSLFLHPSCWICCEYNLNNNKHTTTWWPLWL